MKYTNKSHIMAQMANLAYRDRAKTAYRSLGYANHMFIDIDGAQCHIVWNKDELVVCFRGTELNESSDIKADLNIWPDDAQIGGKVHNGFQNELEKLWEQICAVIDSKLQTRKLFLTGHSLGAAMATVAASRLIPDALFTFGSPRVGNTAFVHSSKAFSEIEHHRFVNNNDIVARVPFALMGYRHHGTLHYINFYGKLRKYTYWQRVKDKVRGRWQALKNRKPFDGSDDHWIGYYMDYTRDLE